jgi:DNA repair protein RadC
MRYLRRLNVELVKGDFANPVKGQVRDPGQVYEVFQSIKDKAQETLLGVYLSDKLEVKGYDVLSVGSQNSTLLAPPEIFSRAFVLMAREFILIHNHPKGDPTPSPGDRKLITLLREQAEVMNLSFLDFIIVGDDRYWSMFAEAEDGEYELGAIH